MKAQTSMAFALAAVLSLPLFTAIAVENEELNQEEQVQVQKQVYGYQLMTEQERAQHRDKMRSATSAEERQAYRLEHHKQMQARAEAQGLSIPDQPGQRGRGCRGGGGGPGSWK